MNSRPYLWVNKVLVGLRQALGIVLERVWLAQSEGRFRKLFPLLLFCLGFGLCHAFLLRRYVRIQEVTNFEAASYVSQGTLLLLPTGQFSAGPSDSGGILDSWLRDDQMLNLLFERRNLFGMALSRIPDAPPDLTAPMLSQNVAIVPVFSTGEAAVSEQTALEGQFQGRRYQAEVYTPSRVLLLKVKAVGESPRVAQSYAEATMGALQHLLIEVATETAAKRKQLLQSQFEQLTQNIKKTKSQVKGSVLTSPEIYQIEEKISILEFERRALLAQVGDLKSRAAQPVIVPLNDEDADRVYVDEEVGLARAEMIYQKGNRQLERLKAAKERGDLRRQQALESVQEAQRRQMIAAAEVKSRAAAECEQQILELRRKLPKPKEQQSEQERQRTLRLWEDELFGVENQLLKTRLELSRAESEGATVVLHPALPGSVNRPVLAQATSRYYQALILLPLSTLLGISLVLAWEILSWFGQRTRQVEEMVDASVVCHLPPLPQGQCRSWDLLKR
jgi:hypothetical protein